MASDSSLKLDINDLVKDLSSKKAFGQLDLGDVFGFEGKKLVGNSDLGDFFNGLSKVNLTNIKLDKIDLDDVFNGIGSFFNNIIGGKDFKIDRLFDDLGEVDLLKGIKLGGLFKNLTDTTFPIFDGVRVDDFLNVIDAVDAIDKPDSTDLLGGIGDVLNSLGKSGTLQNFVVNNLLFGGVGGVAGVVLKGLASNDFIRGGNGVDKLLGQLGNDLINGGLGDDILKGLVGNDVLAGLFDDDLLDGGKGNDTLIGGKGIDELLGGKGNDRFVVELNGGNDLVKDFQNTLDRITVLGKVDFSDLKINQSGRDTIISVGGENIATLRGIKSSLINAADFLFI